MGEDDTAATPAHGSETPAGSGDEPAGGRNRWGAARGLGESLRFLTILPIPGLPMMRGGTARALAAFPLGGAVIGVLGAAVGALALQAFGAPVHAMAVVVAWMALTGGLHLDGVADVGDALFSWRSPERKLEIMQDSRIGTMGALALLAVVGLKVAGLLALGPLWWVGAVIAPVWGRWGNLVGIRAFSANPAGGMGKSFREKLSPRHVVFATASALLVTGLLWPAGALLLPLVAAVVLAAGWRMSRSFGGLTGDCYGTLSELAETAGLLALAGCARHGLLQSEAVWPWMALL